MGFQKEQRFNDSFITLAIQEAKLAESQGKIPIGAVLIKDGKVVATGHNKRAQTKNPLQHAEIDCIQKALQVFPNLEGMILYTTHMPCYMCAGTLIQFGIMKVVAGEADTFPHAQALLETHGIKVINLDLDECKKIHREFVAKNQNLWENTAQKNKPKKEVTQNFAIPFKKEKSLNFYQYPPPKICDNFLLSQLGLNEDNGEQKFAVFISIPYCRTKCKSCPFFKALLPKNKKQYAVLEDYLDLISKQIKFYAQTNRFKFKRCAAIYIGGGTASLLAPKQVERLIKILKQFSFAKEIEITLEGNPNDLTSRYLKRVKKAGITRISVGYQSDDQSVLEIVKSPHKNSKIKNIKKALKLFKTTNIDLLYGVPNQKFSSWKATLKKIIKLNPESITIYRYKAEGTPPLDESFDQYFWAYHQLTDAGYQENRFGNFSKPNHEQQYAKLTYNQGYESIGIGVGAYSSINGYLFKPSNNVSTFKNRIENHDFVHADFCSRKATMLDRIKYYVMHNLFSNKISRNEFKTLFKKDILDTFADLFEKFVRYRLIKVAPEEITLTNLGKKHINNLLYEISKEV